MFPFISLSSIYIFLPPIAHITCSSVDIPVLFSEDGVRQLTPGHGQYLAAQLGDHGGEGRVSLVTREQGEEGIRRCGS